MKYLFLLIILSRTFSAFAYSEEIPPCPQKEVLQIIAGERTINWNQMDSEDLYGECKTVLFQYKPGQWCHANVSKVLTDEDPISGNVLHYRYILCNKSDELDTDSY